MYDLERITKILADLDKFFCDLKELKIEKVSDLEDRKNYHSLSMVLFAIINRIIDLGNEIVVAEKYGMPSTYAETFKILSKRKVIDENMKKEIIFLVRSRNRLSHEYFDFDEKEVFEIYQRISNVKNFIEIVKKKAANRN